MSPAMIDLLTKFGLPTFLLVAVLWTGKRGDWVFGATYVEMQRRLNVDIALLRNEVKELRQQYREDMARERALSDSLLGVGERVAAAAEKAAKQ